MHNNSNDYDNISERFLLNGQILIDEFADSFAETALFGREDPYRLTGVRLFQKEITLSENYIYLATASQVTEEFCHYENRTFLIAGQTDYHNFHESCVVLMVGRQEQFAGIMNSAQQVFEKYREWDRKLQLSLNSEAPLDNMLEASVPIFKNPLFAHDTNFYILACPYRTGPMSVWERDSRTGRMMVPLNLIHEFKVDLEYLRTLSTKGPDIYNEDLRGYRILYRNLWVNGSYEGRLCVNEIQTAFHPGNFAALQYLGNFIELCIQHHNLFHLNLGTDTRRFFTDFLDGKISDPAKVQDFLYFLNWNRTDRYLCLRLEAEQLDEKMHSSVATLGHIESQIPEGRAFIYQQGIVVIVNLSFENSSVAQVISGLAIILREGLFKMGASAELADFFQLPQGYFQAKTALHLGEKYDSMIWSHRFDEYFLEYILEEAGENLSPKLLCSHALHVLKDYDSKNNTELYKTLKIYLKLERNALQTAKALFIHRSSLFYRIERITQLTKINLDDPKERLILQLSYCLMEGTKTFS